MTKEHYWKITAAAVAIDGKSLTVSFEANHDSLERVTLTRNADSWQEYQHSEFALRRQQAHSRWLLQQLEEQYKKNLGL